MSNNPLRRAIGGLAALPGDFYRFVSIDFFYWAAMASTLYTTVYLQEQGFSALEIGSMSSAFTVIGIISPPLWGIASDKMRSVKKAFAICLAASAVFWFALPYGIRWLSPLIVLLILPLYRFFVAPTNALLDSWIVRQCSGAGTVGYGPIRLWGSVGYAIVAFAYAVILRKASINIVFFGYALLSIPCVLIALKTREAGDATPLRPIPLREMQFGRIFKTAPLMAYLIFNMSLYTPIMSSFTFLPFLLQDVGEKGAYMGMIMCAEALLEVPLLFFSARLIKRFKITNLVLLCACVYTLEMSLYATCRASWQILLVKCLHGLSYGLYLGCMVQYLHKLAPKGLSATVQTLSGVSTGLAGILGNLAGGAIINAFGVRVFFRGGGIMIFLSLAGYFIWLRTHKDASGDNRGDSGDSYGVALDNCCEATTYDAPDADTPDADAPMST